MFYRGCEKIQDPKDHCEKTTVAQLGSASKCHCLGDGCNSSSRLKSYFGIVFSILAVIMFRWKYTKYIITISSSYGRTPHNFRVYARQKFPLEFAILLEYQNCACVVFSFCAISFSPNKLWGFLCSKNMANYKMVLLILFTQHKLRKCEEWQST